MGQTDSEKGTRTRPSPAPLNPTVSRTMSRVRRRDTKPELLVRRELHGRGLRYRVDYRGVRGHPDLAFTRARIAVFIDGCFWHRCPIHGTLPKNNADWWLAKLNRNVERDRETDAALREAGWTVLRYWEHDDPLEIADEIEETWKSISSCRQSP